MAGTRSHRWELAAEELRPTVLAADVVALSTPYNVSQGYYNMKLSQFRL